MKLYRTQDLPKLPDNQIWAYETTVTIEANRLWIEFAAVPCRENLDAWRSFWDVTVDPLIREQSSRIIAKCVARNGPGGVDV